MSQLTHIDDRGQARMVDVGDKAETVREASAEAFIQMAPATVAMIRDGDAEKGDVLGTARIAGIMAAKRTHELIPLCHPLMLSSVAVELTLDEVLPGVRVTSTVRTAGRTGVEMEALVAASVAATTVYDMAKAVDRAMVISGLRVTAKSGGKSGDWVDGRRG